MKIAQVSPLYESVPPKFYGGTERVVSYLTEQLVERGHEVTLFASGDSETSAKLDPGCERALRLIECKDPIAPHLVMFEKVCERAAEFDLIHFHIDYLHFPFVSGREIPHLTTLHGRMDMPELISLFRQFNRMPVVSISHSQRSPVPWISWIGNVYHGLPPDRFTFRDEPGKYLLFLGRISPEKRLDRAIEIARRCKLTLKVAAKVDAADRTYFETEIKPLLKIPQVDFIGEVDDKEKNKLLGGAIALLFPIDWPEPFGLVMIEALASGTPVIAFRNGSVPEIITQGQNGFIVNSIDEAVDAVQSINEIQRSTCRAIFEKRFSINRMVNDYLNLYEIVARQKNLPYAFAG